MKTPETPAVPAGGSHAKKEPAKKHTRKGVPKAKARTCGAKTKQCECGHHRREHAGRAARCWTCGEACEVFRHRLCRSNKVMPNGRCRMHGGKIPAGVMSPNWKNGRWAAGMSNPALRKHFYAALGDPELLRTQQDVALIDSMIASLVENLPADTPITEVHEIRLMRLTERRQQALERQARIEQRLGLWIHFTKYQTVMMGMVNVLHEELRTPAGQIDVVMLGRVQKRVEALMVGLAMDQQAMLGDGKGDEDES